jgi:DNA-binding NtrC family response regulator
MNEKVMVIDDDARVLSSVLRALELEGISCVGVNDPTQAVEAFRINPTDVVVVDFVYDSTPDLTGLDVIAEIQRIKPLTRTILISGRIDHDKLDESELTLELQAKVQCDHYLAKSGSREELIAKVKLALGEVESRATDWKAIAKEHVSKREIKAEEAREIKEKLKGNLTKPEDKS